MNYDEMLYWMPEEVAHAILTGKRMKPNTTCIHPSGSYFWWVVFKNGDARIVSAIDWYAAMYRALMEGEIDSIKARPLISSRGQAAMLRAGLQKLGVTSEMVEQYNSRMIHGTPPTKRK